jgi:hypothetical protein
MILPNFNEAFEYENNFWLSAKINRISKVIAHYELYKKVINLSGDVVECGIFKGASFVRFAMMREILGNPSSKKLIGFDSFGKFPKTNFKHDKKVLKDWTAVAGEHSISRKDLVDVLEHKNCNDNFDLVEGDIIETVPAYVNNHPELKISLLNLDTDVYEPAVTILNYLWPKIISGGVLILDDYGVFPGETKAVDEYFAGSDIKIQKFPFSKTPSFIIKE